MEGSIILWDVDRGVGTFRFDEIGPAGDIILTVALFIESGLGHPHAGDRFECDLRLPPSGRLEPHNFRWISNSDVLAKDGIGAKPATVGRATVAGDLSNADPRVWI